MKKTLLSVFFISLLSLVTNSMTYANSESVGLHANFDELLQSADKLRSSDRSQFIAHLNKIEPLFDQLSIDQKYFFTYLNGYKYTYEGKIEQGINSYRHVFDNSQNRKYKHRAAVSLINLYAFTRDWQSGFQYLDYINEVSEQIHEQELRHNGWITSAIFYNELGLYDLALLNVQRLRDEVVAGRNACFTNSIEVKAKVALKLESLDSDYIDVMLKSCRAINEVIIANDIIYSYARHQIDNNQFESANSLLMSELANIEATQYKFAMIGVYALIAKTELNLSNYSAAETYALKATDNEKNFPAIYSVIYPAIEARAVLFQIALAENNYQLAVERLIALNEFEKKQFDDTKSKQLAIEMAKQKAIEKDNEIRLLSNKNQILNLEKNLAKETAQFNSWLIILLIFSVSILIFWMIYVQRSQKKLKYLAEYDSLTGIYNRAYFNLSAETLLNHYSRSDRNASLILFDLDEFKQINDMYGHPAGDQVLTMAAQACLECVRKVDLYGRVGGEEFALLLPGCNSEQALKLAEDCRRQIEAIDLSIGENKISISASFGVADSATCGCILKDLIAKADEAMYLAKRRGRNRVVYAKPSEYSES